MKADTETYQTSNPKVFFRRRHAARAVVGGVGDPRGAASRALGRQDPDGRDGLAEVVVMRGNLRIRQNLPQWIAESRRSAMVVRQ